MYTCIIISWIYKRYCNKQAFKMFTLQLRFNTLKRLFKSNALFSALEAQNSKAVTGLFYKDENNNNKHS